MTSATIPPGTLPAPLTAPDCDLRDFPFMPLDITRLRRSRAWLLAKRDPALAFYMLNLWSAAWHEVPAGSLEDDDLVLADLAMCEPDKWPTVWETVLRGWVKASDGRLYHAVVAEKARDAWERKQEQRARTEAARLARAARRNAAEQPAPEAAPPSVTENATEVAASSVTASKGQGQGQGESFPEGAPGAAPSTSTAALWGEGLARLRRLTGRPESAARALLGKLVKAAGDDRAAVLAALRDCPDTGDPVAWLMGACRPRTPAPGGGAGWNLPSIADPAALAVVAAVQRPRLQ